jgi:hypothetical protein
MRKIRTRTGSRPREVTSIGETTAVEQTLGCVDTYRIHKMMAASVTTAR